MLPPLSGRVWTHCLVNLPTTSCNQLQLLQFLDRLPPLQVALHLTSVQ